MYYITRHSCLVKIIKLRIPVGFNSKVFEALRKSMFNNWWSTFQKKFKFIFQDRTPPPPKKKGWFINFPWLTLLNGANLGLKGLRALTKCLCLCRGPYGTMPDKWFKRWEISPTILCQVAKINKYDGRGGRRDVMAELRSQVKCVLLERVWGVASLNELTGNNLAKFL